MKIDESFLESILYEYKLNQSQLEILGLSYPAPNGWDSILIGKQIDEPTKRKLILLRGGFDLTTQQQIIENILMLENDLKSNISKKSESILTDNILTIYADGACIGNPGHAGSGLSIYRPDQSIELLYGDFNSDGTNNSAELNALFQALTIADTEKESYERVLILCDSQYSIDCVSKWSYSWKTKGWSKKGGPIKNLAIIQKAHELYDRLKQKVTIQHIRGHTGIEGNELADRMAMLAITLKCTQGYKQFEYDTISHVLAMRNG